MIAADEKLPPNAVPISEELVNRTEMSRQLCYIRPKLVIDVKGSILSISLETQFLSRCSLPISAAELSLANTNGGLLMLNDIIEQLRKGWNKLLLAVLAGETVVTPFRPAVGAMFKSARASRYA